MPLAQSRSLLKGLLGRQDRNWNNITLEFADKAARRGLRREKAFELLEALRERLPQTREKCSVAEAAFLVVMEAWFWIHFPREILAVGCQRFAGSPEWMKRLKTFGTSLGLRVEAVSLQRSERETAILEKGILLRFDCLSGVSEAAILAILKDRERHGPFASVDEFCERMEPAFLLADCNFGDTLATLIEAEVFDEFPIVKERLPHEFTMQHCKDALKLLFTCESRFCDPKRRFAFMETLSFIDEKDHFVDVLFEYVMDPRKVESIDRFQGFLDRLRVVCPKTKNSACLCGIRIGKLVFDLFLRDGTQFYDQAAPFLGIASSLTAAAQDPSGTDAERTARSQAYSGSTARRLNHDVPQAHR